MNQVTKQFLNRSLKFIGFWLVIGFLIYLIGRFNYLFLPFILAFIMSAAISPLKNFLMRRFRLPPGPAVIIAMIVEIGGLGAFITLLVVRLILELQEIYIHWPFYNKILQRFIMHGLTKIEVYLELPGMNDHINSTALDLVGKVPAYLSYLFSLAAKIPEIVIIIVIAIVATFFMSKRSKRYLNDLLRIFPGEWRDSLKELGADFTKAFAGFVRAEFFVFLITLFCCLVGIMIIHPRYALILGTITALFGILPVLGVGIILVPWAVIAFVGGHNLLGIELLLLTGIITILRHIVEPKILGDNTGLDPLFVLMSMYIGLAATGVVGLILGPFVLIAYHSLSKAGVFRNL